jgi:hypothetical protein
MGDGSTCDPNPCQASGACCLPDGECIEATPTDCTESDGTFQGEGTACTPELCPEPTGACCLLGDVCNQTTLSDCNASGGLFLAGLDCDACEEGACCFEDGTCAITQGIVECLQMAGNYLGGGTNCDACAGACCYSAGGCLVMSEAMCVETNGTFQGDGTACAPNPCPQPMGACCFSDGSCEVTTLIDCSETGGTFQGSGTTCPDACRPPSQARSGSRPRRAPFEMRPLIEFGEMSCSTTPGDFALQTLPATEPADCNDNGIPDVVETAPEFDPETAEAADNPFDGGNYVCTDIFYHGHTFGATNDTDFFCGTTYGGLYDVWYCYRPATSGTAVAKVCEFQFSVGKKETAHGAIVSAWGAGPNGLYEIACNFNSNDGTNCGVIFSVEGGETYYIRIAGEENSQGEFELEVKGPRCLLNPIDLNENRIPDECECLADVNGDGVVDHAGTLAVVAVMGGACDGCPEDINLDGVVDEQDLQIVLGSMGPCPQGGERLTQGHPASPDARGGGSRYR